jgi:hypothetical protein
MPVSVETPNSSSNLTTFPLPPGRDPNLISVTAFYGDDLKVSGKEGTRIRDRVRIQRSRSFCEGSSQNFPEPTLQLAERSIDQPGISLGVGLLPGSHFDMLA